MWKGGTILSRSDGLATGNATDARGLGYSEEKMIAKAEGLSTEAGKTINAILLSLSTQPLTANYCLYALNHRSPRPLR
jgi:hypothetical protein